MRHDLKTWPGYFQAVKCGEKPFEIRSNDRDFKVDDILLLREFDPLSGRYTREVIERRVTYVLTDAYGFGLRNGFVALGIEPVEKGGAAHE